MLLRKAILASLTILMMLVAATASAGDRWLHVRVDEGGRHGDRVRVQIPLKMIRAMLPLIETDEFHDGRVYLGHADLDGTDVRAMLAAVREAEDGEYVRIDSRDELVRVAKQGGFLHVKVEERDAWDDESDIVRVKIPMTVVEAMVIGDSDEIDLAAAIDALDTDSIERMDLVTVDDGYDRVRVWIDQRHEDLDDNDDNNDL